MSKIFFLFVVLVLANIFNIEAKVGEDRNPYLHKVTLDKKYFLEWMVDWEERRVVFSATVATRGYVGLGLSRSGKMSGADIFIGGVFPNGKPYFSDRHAKGLHKLPVEDLSQDWTLHSAWENSSHTFLSFSRAFDTCDEEHDLPINDDTVALIWAFGEKDDDLEYHNENKGSFLTHLLDPDLTPRGISVSQTSNHLLSHGNESKGVQIWTISGSQVLPPKDTTYLCSIHKAPTRTKAHIIGFNAVLPTELDRKHIHHFILYHCGVPKGFNAEEIFEPVLNEKEICYVLSEPSGRIPTNYCTAILYPLFLPEHTGVPISEESTDYFMLQMHFDNPNELTGIKVNYALELFITDKLRAHDAGVLGIGQVFPGSPSILIPPNSLAHKIYGHCASTCTKSMFPEEGIKIVVAKMHTHYAGRRSRISLIRNNVEMVVANDDNYKPSYQKMRVLREEVHVLPGDQLIQRCVFDNTDKNGSVTVGGFPSRQEMCVGIIYYYNKIPNRSLCGSEIRSEVYNNFLNIQNLTWSDEEIEMIVTSPEEHKRLTVSEVANGIDWTISRRRKLQRMHRYLPQVGLCPPDIPEEEENAAELARYFQSIQNYSQKESEERDSLESSEETFSNPREISLLANPSLPDYKKEIVDPGSEFVSVYSRNVIHKKLKSSCKNKD